MSYQYAVQRQEIFTEQGNKALLKVRDRVKKLLEIAGAARMQEIMASTTGDSWLTLACVDYLVELGEIVELPRDCWRQYKVYTSPEVHNL